MFSLNKLAPLLVIAALSGCDCNGEPLASVRIDEKRSPMRSAFIKSFGGSALEVWLMSSSHDCDWALSEDASMPPGQLRFWMTLTPSFGESDDHLVRRVSWVGSGWDSGGVDRPDWKVAVEAVGDGCDKRIRIDHDNPAEEAAVAGEFIAKCCAKPPQPSPEMLSVEAGKASYNLTKAGLRLLKRGRYGVSIHRVHDPCDRETTHEDLALHFFTDADMKDSRNVSASMASPRRGSGSVPTPRSWSSASHRMGESSTSTARSR